MVTIRKDQKDLIHNSNHNSRFVARESNFLPGYGGAWLVLALALGSFTLNLGGQLMATEIILLIIAFILIFSDLRAVRSIPFFGLIQMSLLVGIGAYLASDLINDSSSVDLVKGASRWIFLWGAIISISYVFLKNRYAPEYAMLGLALAGLYGAWKGAAEEGWGWKFSLGEPFTALLLIVATRLPRAFSVSLCLCLGLMNFFLDYRSLGGACIICGAFAAVRGIRFHSPGFLMAGVMAVILLLIGGYGYQKAILTDDTRLARSVDSNEIRLTGASFGWEAIKLSPFVGHGTWASNRELLALYVQMRQDSRQERGARITGEESANEAVVGAIHSMILQAGAEAGLIAVGVFIIYIYIIAKAFWLSYRNSSRMLASEVLCIYILTLALWALFSSPFAGFNRLLLALGLAAAARLFFLAKTQQQKR